jgi:uncharacterized protein YqeY
MTLYEKILADFKDAFKSGDTTTRGTLAMLKSAIKQSNRKRGKDVPPTDEEVMEIIGSGEKNGRDSVPVSAATLSSQKRAGSAVHAVPSVQLPRIGPADRGRGCEVRRDKREEMGKVLGLLSGALKGRADATRRANCQKKLLG